MSIPSEYSDESVEDETQRRVDEIIEGNTKHKELQKAFRAIDEAMHSTALSAVERQRVLRPAFELIDELHDIMLEDVGCEVEDDWSEYVG